MAVEILSDSPEETQRVGEAIGRCLRGGEVLGIEGDLGAGKTCLVRGIARGLELDPDVIYSPSFTLVAEHLGRVQLNHIDLFRLAKPLGKSEGEEIGLEEYLEPRGVTVIEWYENLGGERMGVLSLKIGILIQPENHRILRISAENPRGEEVLRVVAAAMGYGVQ